MGTSANAALIASNTIPAGGLSSPSTAGIIYWDIDNDLTNDFSLENQIFSLYAYISFNAQDNARIARQTSSLTAIPKLSSGAKLGTASDQLVFNSNPVDNMVMADVPAGIYTGYGVIGWSVGDTGYFGFKFTKDSNTHYGWAEMTLSATTAQFTINEAWYNDTPDGAVTVGVVPEPAHVGLGLGALALGAAGLRRMRQKRKVA